MGVTIFTMSFVLKRLYQKALFVICVLGLLVGFAHVTLYQSSRVNKTAIPIVRDTVNVKQSISNMIAPPPLPEPDVVNQSPTPIILLAYFRSGSSFVGDLIQAHEDVFYLFEPLRPSSVRFKLSKDTSAKSTSRYRDKTTSILYGLSRCRFHDVPWETFADDLFMNKSRRAKLYRQCLHNHSITHGNKTLCFNNLLRSCMESDILLIKVIRPSFSVLLPLMEAIPRLKIIYLQRDPRALAKRHNEYGMFKKETEIEYVTKLCNRLYDDATVADMVQQKYPDRFMSLFYEEVAYQPIKHAQRIYKFADLKFGSKHQEIITTMTRTETPKSVCRGVCTTRISSRQAEEWRTTTTLQFAQVVDACCIDYYQKIGYRDIPNLELLRDLNITLRRPLV